jgi:hypothetical protein
METTESLRAAEVDTKTEEAARRELLKGFKSTRRPDPVLAFEDPGRRIALKSSTDPENKGPLPWQIFGFDELVSAELLVSQKRVLVKVTVSTGPSPLFVLLWANRGNEASIIATAAFGVIGYAASKSISEQSSKDADAVVRGSAIVDALRAVKVEPTDAQSSTVDPVAEIERWHALLQSGVVTEDEFAQAKARIIASL